jgi:hypothetical protein
MSQGAFPGERRKLRKVRIIVENDFRHTALPFGFVN